MAQRGKEAKINALLTGFGEERESKEKKRRKAQKAEAERQSLGSQNHDQGDRVWVPMSGGLQRAALLPESRYAEWLYPRILVDPNL